jgi:hypothetical protein
MRRIKQSSSFSLQCKRAGSNTAAATSFVCCYYRFNRGSFPLCSSVAFAALHPFSHSPSFLD